MASQGRLYRLITAGDLGALQMLSNQELLQEFTIENTTGCSCGSLLEGLTSSSIRKQDPETDQLTLEFLAELQILNNWVTAGSVCCGCEQRSNSYVLGAKAIHIAAFHSQPHIVRHLIEIGEDVNLLTKHLNRSALHLVACGPIHTARTLECAMLLIHAGCSLSSTDDNGNTSLHLASSHGSTNLVQLLIDKGCSVDHLNFMCTSPLAFAVVRFHYKIVECLIEAGASVCRCRCPPPLIVAMQRSDMRMMKILLKCKDPDLFKSCSSFPGDLASSLAVHYAADQGDIEMTKLLLDHGAPVDEINEDGNTALTCMAFKGNLNMARLLIDNGSDLNFANNCGYSSIHQAAWEGHLPFLHYLVNSGALYDEQTKDLNTPLSLACHGNQTTCIEYLLQLSCNVNNADKDLDTPLLYTTFNSNFHCTKLLIENGADPDAENCVRTTPLWNAVFQGNFDIVRTLLRLNVRPSVASVGIDHHENSNEVNYIFHPDPETPLQMACVMEYHNIAKALLFSGAPIDFSILSQIPSSTEEQREFRAWLQDFTSNALPLKQICRVMLRKHLGRSLNSACEQLELPLHLKEFLTMKYFDS